MMCIVTMRQPIENKKKERDNQSVARKSRI
jgi:hypothetical protein